MSFFYNPPHTQSAQANQVARPQSPSFASVLSDTNFPSTIDDDLNHEWVLFSPQINPAESLRSSEPEELDLPQGSLELPSHNGEGSFVADQKHFNTERINLWRLDQSRLVLDELHRLERKFRPVYPESQSDDMSWTWKDLARGFVKAITMDDEVLDLLFAGPEHIKDPPQAEARKTAFERSQEAAPNWDQAVVRKLLTNLGIERAPTLSILRRLLTWRMQEREGPAPQPTVSPVAFSREYYWDDESSSISTSVY